jgi:hypothetical protein
MSTREHLVVTLTTAQAKVYAKKINEHVELYFQRLSKVENENTLLQFSEGRSEKCGRMVFGSDFLINNDNIHGLLALNTKGLEIQGNIELDRNNFVKLLNITGRVNLTIRKEARAGFIELFLKHQSILSDEALDTFKVENLFLEAISLNYINSLYEGGLFSVDKYGDNFIKLDWLRFIVLEAMSFVSKTINRSYDLSKNPNSGLVCTINASITNYIMPIEATDDVREKNISRLIDILKASTCPVDLNGKLQFITNNIEQHWEAAPGGCTQDLVLFLFNLEINNDYIRQSNKISFPSDFDEHEYIRYQSTCTNSQRTYISSDKKFNPVNLLDIAGLNGATAPRYSGEINAYTITRNNKNLIITAMRGYAKNCEILVKELSKLNTYIMTTKFSYDQVRTTKRLSLLSCLVECPEIFDDSFIDLLIENVTCALEIDSSFKAVCNLSDSRIDYYDLEGEKPTKPYGFKLEGLHRFRGVSFKIDNIDVENIRPFEIVNLIHVIRGTKLCLASFGQGTATYISSGNLNPADEKIFNLILRGKRVGEISIGTCDFSKINFEFIDSVLSTMTNSDNGLLALDHNHKTKFFGTSDTLNRRQLALEFKKVKCAVPDLFSSDGISKFAACRANICVDTRLARYQFKDIPLVLASETTTPNLIHPRINDVTFDLNIMASCKLDEKSSETIHAYSKKLINVLTDDDKIKIAKGEITLANAIDNQKALIANYCNLFSFDVYTEYGGGKSRFKVLGKFADGLSCIVDVNFMLTCDEVITGEPIVINKLKDGALKNVLSNFQEKTGLTEYKNSVFCSPKYRTNLGGYVREIVSKMLQISITGPKNINECYE